MENYEKWEKISAEEQNAFDKIAIIMGMDREEFMKFAEDRGLLHPLLEKFRELKKLKKVI